MSDVDLEQRLAAIEADIHAARIPFWFKAIVGGVVPLLCIGLLSMYVKVEILADRDKDVKSHINNHGIHQTPDEKREMAVNQMNDFYRRVIKPDMDRRFDKLEKAIKETK
jgi:hypothetical protein